MKNKKISVRGGSVFSGKGKKIVFAVLVFCAAFGLGTFLRANAAFLTGYLWGGSEAVSGGVINGNESGVGWIDVSSVDVPASDGNATGYGWSENIGWVDFNPAGPYPEAPNNSVQRVGNNLNGWARIVGIATASAAGNSGGFDGWVKMISVVIDPATGQMSGYGWSGDLGWIDFSGANAGVAKVLDISLAASPNSCVGCASLSFNLTASRLATSTTGGNIQYEFDCDGDGEYDDGIHTTSNTAQSQSCSVSSTATVGVRMTQEGVVKTTPAVVSVLSSVCGDGSITGTEICDDGAANGACPATCNNATCTPNSCPTTSRIYREVAP